MFQRGRYVTESHYASNHGLLRTLVFSCVIVQNLFVVFLRNTSFRHGTSCKIQANSCVTSLTFSCIFCCLDRPSAGTEPVLSECQIGTICSRSRTKIKRLEPKFSIWNLILYLEPK